MSTPSQKKKCFFISPIGKDGSPERKAADQVLRHLVRKALGADFDVERADESSNPGSITPAMITAILEADLIVADLSGFNPNVFYEVALAHGYQKQTVHVQVLSERPPFDVKDVRIVQYDLADPDQLEGAQKRLAEYAKYAMDHPEKVETPIATAAKFAAVQTSTDPAAESNVLVLNALEELRTEVRQAVRPGRTASQATKALLEQAKTDNRQVRRILARVMAEHRLESTDFESAITRDTSPGFDQWAQDVLAEVMHEDDQNTLLRILWSAELGDPEDEPGELRERES